jgi:hypothetical protein
LASIETRRAIEDEAPRWLTDPLASCCKADACFQDAIERGLCEWHATRPKSELALCDDEDGETEAEADSR